MKLIIPMSGKGSRFVSAGYPVPKPLIVVDGKPVIAHVLDIFPGETNIIFLCSNSHLADTNMREILTTLRPEAVIVGIDTEGSPKGPIPPMTQSYHLINDDEEVIVSYCDYGQVWDYEAFKSEVNKRQVAGALPSYTGFHPHLLHRNLYGGILADNENLVLDYREKHSFTDNPEDSYHSVGCYYFRNGAMMKRYCDEVISTDLNVNGEYYTSLPYYYMKRDGLPIYVAPVEKFMQWGTPEDLEEYEAWSRLVHEREGLTKAYTDIPPHREEFVKIPYPEDSEKFKMCYQYWKEYFCSKK